MLLVFALLLISFVQYNVSLAQCKIANKYKATQYTYIIKYYYNSKRNSNYIQSYKMSQELKTA